MLEFINHARKLAYDDTRSFYFVRSADKLTKKNGSFLIECTAAKFESKNKRGFDQVLVGYKSTTEEKKVRILIDCTGERAFRIRYGLDESFDNNTLMAPSVPDGSLKEYEEKENAYIIRNKHAALSITKYPFYIRLIDEKGNILNNMPGIDECHPNASGAGLYPSLKDFFPFGFSDELLTFTSMMSLNEKIYGLGERFPGIDRRGQQIEFYHQDCAGNEGTLTYKNIPFYMSTDGYGVFVNSSALMDFDIGMKNYDYTNIFLEDRVMDIFLIAGPDMKDVLKAYCEITGFSPKLPRWSYGLWMSRNSYETKDIALNVARDLRKREIPCDVIHLDTYWFERDWVCDLKFSEDRFSNPEEMMKEFEKMGFVVSLWQLPFVHPEIENYRIGEEKGYFIKTQDGAVYKFHWFGRYYAMLDYSNEEAVEWYLDQIEKVLRIGAKAIKTDMPENCPSDGVYNNIEAKKMHNLFPLIYNKVIYERTKKVHGEGIVWGRSTYAGGQRYPLHWSGDPKSTYENMAGALRSGLSFGLSGHSFWSHDIGGFIGKPTERLYIRWAQLGLFSSHSRCHGGGNTNPREPWAYGEQANEIFKKYAYLRYKLLPYIFSTEAECCQTGLPFLRHLVLYHQKDRNTHHIHDQYYFGKNMMVAPILTDSDKREVYLPEGTWYEFETGKKIEKSGWMEIESPIDKIPIFIPAGAIIVMGPKMQHVDEKEIEELEIHIYAGKTSEFNYVNKNVNVIFKAEYINDETIFHDGGYKGRYKVKIYD